MKEISQKQMIFVKTYAGAHCFFGVITLMVFVLSGDGDINSISLSSGTALSNVGVILTFYFFAPLILAKNLGIPLPTIKHLEYLWLLFVGIIYGLVYLYIYKIIKNR